MIMSVVNKWRPSLQRIVDKVGTVSIARECIEALQQMRYDSLAGSITSGGKY